MNATYGDLCSSLVQVCGYFYGSLLDQRFSEIYSICCVNQSIIPLNERSSGQAEWQLLTMIVLSLLTPVGILANTLILLTFYEFKNSRNATSYFICNLAVSDILNILLMVIYVSTSGDNLFYYYVISACDIFVGSSCMLFVSALSIERGIAVSFPFRYRTHFDDRTAIHTSVGIWIYCLLMLVAGLLRLPITLKLYFALFFYVAVTLSFFIPCFLFVISYGSITMSAIRNIRRDKKLKRETAAAICTDNLRKRSTQTTAKFREMKVAFNVAIITMLFVFGWGYFIGSQIYEMLSGLTLTGFPNWLIEFIPFIISCVNPLIYIMCTRSLKKNSQKLLSGWKTRIIRLLSFG